MDLSWSNFSFQLKLPMITRVVIGLLLNELPSTITHKRKHPTTNAHRFNLSQMKKDLHTKKIRMSKINFSHKVSTLKTGGFCLPFFVISQFRHDHLNSQFTVSVHLLIYPLQKVITISLCAQSGPHLYMLLFSSLQFKYL